MGTPFRAKVVNLGHTLVLAAPNAHILKGGFVDTPIILCCSAYSTRILGLLLSLRATLVLGCCLCPYVQLLSLGASLVLGTLGATLVLGCCSCSWVPWVLAFLLSESITYLLVSRARSIVRAGNLVY